MKKAETMDVYEDPAWAIRPPLCDPKGLRCNVSPSDKHMAPSQDVTSPLKAAKSEPHCKSGTPYGECVSIGLVRPGSALQLWCEQWA